MTTRSNAVAENFFATLKKELVHRRSWPTRHELTGEVFDGAIALERPGIGDLLAVGNDRATVQRTLREAYPDEKEGTIRAWTTVLLRFAFEPQLGDFVIHPDPPTRTISVGRITGRYEFEFVTRDLHRRTAQWLLTGIPRDELMRRRGLEPPPG